VTDYNHEEDVVYGYKDGVALVMDVYTPRDPRVDAGILWVTAGGWPSGVDWRHSLMRRAEGAKADNLARCLLDAGYVVFAIDDLRSDVPRAVRFVRHHAGRFRIDGERLGMLGFSSGGHVSLLTSAAPPPPDPEAIDPVDRVSSCVQAVTAFYAPTVADAAARQEIFRQNSPTTHVDGATPPSLLFHGDADVVPLQQSEVYCQRLQEAGVAHKLVVLTGVGHETLVAPEDGRVDVIDWFGRYLGPGRG
jgi:acetyl esterase/lipase